MKFFLFILLFSFSLNVFAEELKTNDLVTNVPPPNTVALTFDDGPHPVYTPEILAILKKNNIKATFFVVGTNAQKYPDLIKQIYEEGHVIASHSYSHPLLTKLNDKELHREILRTSEIVNDIIGIKPKCLRYPFGASNQHVREEIRNVGMLPTSMGFNSFDYERPGTKKIIAWVLNNLRDKQVILLHDGFNKREQTVEALPKIIEGVQKKGLGFSTICA